MSRRRDAPALSLICSQCGLDCVCGGVGCVVEWTVQICGCCQQDSLFQARCSCSGIYSCYQQDNTLGSSLYDGRTTDKIHSLAFYPLLTHLDLMPNLKPCTDSIIYLFLALKQSFKLCPPLCSAQSTIDKISTHTSQVQQNLPQFHFLTITRCLV